MLKSILVVCCSLLAAVHADTPNGTKPAPWGELLGVTNGVKVYSNDNPPPVDPESYYPEGTDWTNGTYVGLKWQCVELARRYFLITQGVVFESVDDAAEIFQLRTVKNVTDKARLPLHVFPQGSATPPQVGSLLIWARGGAYDPFGHVAVIVNVQDSYVDVAEQNIENIQWRQGAYYSRRIPAKHTPGSFTILPYFNRPNVSETVLGWVTFNPRHAC